MNKKVAMLLILCLATSGIAGADMIQHLDATVSGSVTGSPVSQWSDQTSYNNHATSAIGNVYYPSTSLSTSGLAGLDLGVSRNTLELFDATGQDSWLNQTLGSGFAVLIAFKADAVTGDWNDLIGNSSAVTSGFGLRYSNVGAMQAYLGGLTINKSGAVVSAGDTIVYAFNYSASGNSYEFWDSKSDSSTTGTVTAGDFSLSTVVTLGSTDNSNRYMRGMVGEVKIYNAALSSGEFETQRDALVTKWVVIVDNDPPTPNPATWESAPSAVNAFAVSMTATTGSDINGVEYMFTETTGNPGATSSQWQKTPVYRDDFLEPLTEYRYTVTMRDYAEPANVGTASSEVIVTTPDVVPGRTDGPPNVVVLYADDLGYSDISYNAPAGSFSNTPTLDSICTNGVYFSNYVTHHVCSPSRAGLLTGRHYTRVGAGPEVGGTLDNSIPNMAKDFQAAGYETAAYGKWHNSSVPDDKGNAIYVSSRDLVIRDNDTYEQYRDIAWGEGVNAYGFDDWAGFYGGGSDYFDRFGSWSNEIDWWINGVFSPHTPGYTQDLIAANAANFITENAHQPFFVHVAMEAVHTPYHIKRSDLETMCGIVDDIDPSLAWNNVKLLASPTTSNLIQDVEELRCTPGDEFDKDVLDGTLSGFADLVYSTLAYALDNTTGQILDRLDEHGLTNNTIIVFASDNGGTTSGNNWPFTGSKHTLWEGGIHVPAAIWWPGTLDASTAPYSPGNNSYSHMTQYFDWYPTLMSMTGSTLNGTDLDGLNLHANLLSRTATRSGFENCYFGLDSDWGTVRTERWKLHFNRIPGNQKIELYDLENDIDESNNVQASNPVERDTLIALFDQWFDSGAVSSNYMPLHEDNISYPLPAPDSDILEVQATQTVAISNPNDGVYVRYAVSDTRDYDNYIHANDQFQFDIYVADDSDHIDGIYCTPGGGWTPKFDTNNGVNSRGELVTEKVLPKGQWIRQVVGMGELAALPSPVQYIALRNTSAGYYHFYIDNVIIRKADGTIRDVVWSQNGDRSASTQYRYKGVVYYSWAEVTAVAGFPFSDITMTTVDMSILPVDTIAPPVPASLTAISGIGSVSLDWADDNDENGVGSYNVYRSTTSGGYGTALDSGIQKSKYVDNGANNGTTYHYVVKAVDTSGNESGNSNEDSALPPDRTDDNRVDLKDLAKVAAAWLTTYDLNDLSVIAANWLEGFSLSYWNLDETTGSIAHDASSNAYDGTLMNMDDSDWVPGKTGNGLDFDGVNDYVAVDNICTWMAGGDVTVSAWMKAPAVNPATQFIISINTATGDNRLLCGTSAGIATLSLGDTAWHHTTATVIDNTWHHIAYVLDDGADTVTVYVDGSEALSFTSTVSVVATDVFSLGQEYDGIVTGDFYSGQLDDVRVYNWALSEAEIAILAQ